MMNTVQEQSTEVIVDLCTDIVFANARPNDLVNYIETFRRMSPDRIALVHKKAVDRRRLRMSYQQQPGE